LKKSWKLLKDNAIEAQEKRRINKAMDEVYKRNLLKKAFFPWRTLTFKDGYTNTVRR
jgi:hypothetical protein